MKRALLLLSLAGVGFLLGFTYSYQVDRFKVWLIYQIAEQSQHSNVALVLPKKIDFSGWPLGVRLKDIKIVPQGATASFLAPIQIEEVGAYISPLSLLLGNFGISEIAVKSPQATVILKRSRFERPRVDSNEIKISPLIAQILKMPIENINIDGLSIKFRSELHNVSSKIDDFEIRFVNRRSHMTLSMQTSSLTIKQSNKKTLDPFDFSLRIFAKKNLLTVSSFKVSHKNSSLQMTGEARGPLEFKGSDIIDLNLKTQLEVSEILSQANRFFPDLHFPSAGGSLKTSAKLNWMPDTPLSTSAQLSGENLKVDGREVGHIEGNVAYTNEKIQLGEFKMKSSAGAAYIPQGLVDLENKNLQFKLIPQNLELRSLLSTIKVSEVPLHLDINGELDCATPLNELLLKCDGYTVAENFRVYYESPPAAPQTIVALPRAKVEGGIVLDKNDIKIKTKVSMKDTEGTIDGIVDFEKGFKFNFKSDQLAFSDLSNVVDLKIEGATAIEGTTEGNSETARVDYKIRTKNFWLEDFGIGQAESTGYFSKGILAFEKVDGIFRTSKFRGNIYLDVNNQSIKAKAEIPYLELNDLQKMFQRKFDLPFDSFGSGAAQIEVSGPLEFTALSYKLKSSVGRGTIAAESFSEAHFDIHAEKGEVTSDRIVIKKGKGSASAQGKGYPNGQILLNIRGGDFLIEESENISALGLKLAGLLKFEMKLEGHVFHPDTDFNGQISKVLLGTDPVSDVNLGLSFSKRAISGWGQMADKNLGVDFTFPIEPEAPFKLNLSAQNWNFAPLFTLIYDGISTKDFQANTTLAIKLSSDSGGFWNSSGSITVDSFYIKKGALAMSTNQPVKASMNAGLLKVEKFAITGDNTLLNMEASSSTKNNLNMRLHGKVDLSLVSFLTPFLSEIRGIMAISLDLVGAADKPRLTGTAYVTKGYAKSKDLIHPFEDFDADVIFNHEKILINHFITQFATGKVLAEGVIEIVGLKNFPTNIRGTFENVNLNIPEGVATRGNGDFKITGNWFPFLFAANYKINDGLITKNFDEEDPNARAQVRRSSFLPQMLLKKEFDALQFDIHTQIEKNLKVRNNMVDAEAAGQLNIRGSSSNPNLLGEISLKKGGKLFFRETPFEISTTIFKFTDPKEIDPSIYAAGQARVKQYDINLLIQGTRKKFTINLRSSPDLPEQEIISLLALGLTSAELEQASATNRSTRTGQGSGGGLDSSLVGIELGTAILSRNPLGKEIKKKYGFDLKFSSQVDPTDNSSLPKISLSKQWTPKIGTSASRTIGNKVTQDVKLQYQLNNNLSLIGSWEGRGFSEEAGDTTSQDLLGVDLNYKVEFK